MQKKDLLRLYDCHCYWLFADVPFDVSIKFLFHLPSMRDFLEASPGYDVTSFIVLGSISQKQFAHPAYTNINANANCRMTFLHKSASKSYSVKFFYTIHY